MDLIERLRSVKWEVADDGDRVPDDPAFKCVFVDMRPAEFEALLTEAAAALEAAREEIGRLRADRDSWEQQASERVADWYAEHLRAERLAEALRRYGVHDETCVAMDIPFCTCGLDAALEQETTNG